MCCGYYIPAKVAMSLQDFSMLYALENMEDGERFMVPKEEVHDADHVDHLLPESRVILELQKHWLEQYDRVRCASLSAAASKLFEEFKQELIDDDKRLREELDIELKEKRQMTINFYRAQVDDHLSKLQEKYDAVIADVKKYQWCCQCGKKARLNCCYNCSYCSTECQSKNWAIHRIYCRRPRAIKNSDEETAKKA
ncbi:hypothetical protein QR680_018792 [Steinernema hermaphroditum]|uniref:MYND-type domain-containing protein n=1 Tax=Steinernema hermaphroditum TaxID=289476 RepID=A0AA39HJZ4_9BILA|nr:hypothetical protein QR680_018792 [Steinernema hermaphroditum]